MRPTWIPTFALTFALACGGGGDPGESGADGGTATEEGSDVANETLEAWTENAEGVAAYTITLDVDGTERTDRYVRAEDVEGLPVFRPEGADAGATDAMAAVPRLLRSARHDGESEIDGETTDVLVVDDAAMLTQAFPEMAEGPFRPLRIEFQVGSSDRLPRRMTMVGEATMPGGAEPTEVTTTVDFADWREVDGFRYPFRTTARTEGFDMGAAAAGAMAEAEAAIERLPEAQREMAREAMARSAPPQAEGGAMETVTVVKELEVERE